jgi:hypothetical protein
MHVYVLSPFPCCHVLQPLHVVLPLCRNETEVCLDGVDNDGNGLVDKADPGCYR